MQVFDTAGRLLVSQAGGGGGGSVNFSAGTESANLGSVVFSNSNGVSFGLSAGTITASAAAGAGGSLNVSAGTTSNNLTDLVFSNANGVSFGLDGSTVTGTVQTNYLTTAMASNRGSDFVNATAAFAGTSASGTIASNGISVSIGPYITTAMLSNAVTLSNIRVSAGTTSNLLSAVTFANGNGISFGLNAGTVTGSHNAITTARASNDGVGLNTAQTNVTWTVNSNGLSLNAAGYAGTGFTSTTTAGTEIEATQNTAGLSMAVPLFLTTAMQSNAATISNIRVSAGTTSNNLSALTFDNAGGVSFGLNGSVITGAAPAGAPSPVNFSAGTTSNNLASVVFSNSNGVSFGLNGSTITGSVAAAAGSINLSAGTTSQNLTNFVLSNSNGVSFGLNGSTVTASYGDMADYFANLPALAGTQTMTVNQSTSHILQLRIREALSFDFVRMLMSGSVIAASTTAATTGNTQFSCGYTKSHNFAIYSRGSGASSSSLQYYISTQIVENYSHNVSAAANSTQFSYSQRYTMPHSTGLVGFTSDYSSSAASLNFHSSNITGLTALKQIDFKFGTTLSAGEWWLMYGASSTSSSQFTSVGFRNVVTFNFLGVSAGTQPVGTLGGATSSSCMFYNGVGSFTTVGGATTSSLAFSNISSSASNNVAYVQLMRSN